MGRQMEIVHSRKAGLVDDVPIREGRKIAAEHSERGSVGIRAVFDRREGPAHTRRGLSAAWREGARIETIARDAASFHIGGQPGGIRCREFVDGGFFVLAMNLQLE